MIRVVRGALIGLIALLSLAAIASTASAVLTQLRVSPSGAYTATAVGNTLLRLLSNGLTLTCTSSRIGATISSNGAGTSPAGSAVYSGCTQPLLGAFTVTQTSAWSLRVVGELLTASPSLVLVGLEVNLPASGVQVSSPLCTFWVSGSVTAGKLFGPLALPITQAVSTADQFVVLPLPKQTLVVDRILGGCGSAGIVVGLTSTYTGTYVLNRAATVSQ